MASKFDFTSIQGNEVKEKQYKGFIKEAIVYLQQIKDLQDSYTDAAKQVAANLNDGFDKEHQIKVSTLTKIVKTKMKNDLEEEKAKLEELEDGLFFAEKK